MVLFLALAHLLGFISSIHAVMSTRTSQGAVAWVVSLNGFPYVAVPAYWVFGRNKFQGCVTARRTKDRESTRELKKILEKLTPFLLPDADKTEATRAAEGLAEMPLLTGNHVELLIDGQATFDSILQGIDSARDCPR